MNKVNCPYCDGENDLDYEDLMEEGDPHERECRHCDKMFVFSYNVFLSFESYKADCLNGSDHIMEPVVSTTKFDPPWMRCKDCGKETRGKLIGPLYG